MAGIPVAGIQPSYAQDPAAGQATLNFVGADIESVIKAIGHYTNRTFIIDPRVKGTINVVSEKPVTKAEAFQLLTSALRLQGYAVVTSDGFVKVVPEADAKLQAGPTQSGADPGRPDRDPDFPLELRIGGQSGVGAASADFAE